ncbi:MAG: hypothetical protein ACFCUQ_16920 [Kiloniellales bacterium]
MNLRQERWSSTAAGAFLATIAAVLVAPATGAAQTYETPPTLKASEILPENLVQGPDFRVKEEVVNDGVVNTYTIDSTFGQFSAVTTAKLRQRVGEVIALRQMETVRQSDTFQKSIVESGKDTLGTVQDVVTDPVGTVSGAVSGIGKAFARAGEGLFGSARSEAEDSRFESLIGLSKTKREYAFDFGVDVYSDNEVLQQRLDELARASYAGGLVYSAALSMVPGAAGLAISATGMTHLTNEIYRTTAPTDLRRMNRQKLTAMGVRQDAVDHFVDNAKFSPRDQTELVLALEKMPEAKNRELFILLATLTSDRDMALFRQRQAQMYAGYHRTVVPIDSFVAFGEFVGAHDRQGRIVFNVPLDYLVWTEWMAKVVSGVDKTIAAIAGVTGKEVVLAGSLSPYARQQFTERGWTVSDNAEQIFAAK